MLLDSLSDPSKNVIRSFRLRRGLNILWAKPFQPERAENTGESFAGHAAGKTLFCRMIRYLLGERHLGNEIVQARVAGGFSDGWVIGTIFIEDSPWLVGRPFASKHGQFAVQGKTTEDFLEGRVEERPHYDAFQDALHRRVTRDHRLREFPDKGGRIDIQHLLPWFTRDQEARYGSASGWREAASGAEPMATDNEDRHFLMRVPADHFNLFKSLTEFTWVDRTAAYRAAGVSPHNPKPKTIYRTRICSPRVFRERIRGAGLIWRNPEHAQRRGIPQGAPISALL